MRSLLLPLLIGALLGGCEGTIDQSGPDDAGLPDGTPFEPAAAAQYVNKVKNLLVGLPATDAEIAQVVADPNAIRGLIDQWMALPAFEERSLDFFRNAFQQNGVSLKVLETNSGVGLDYTATVESMLERSMMDSFPKTVWELVKADQPLNKAVNTDTYLLTTAEMVMLSYLDEVYRTDTNALTRQYTNQNIAASISWDPASTATYAQSIDPANPAFMKFKDRAVAGTGCAPAAHANTTGNRFDMLLSDILGRNSCVDPANSTARTVDVPPVLTDADFADWHLVKITPAGATAAAAPTFWDVPGLRTASTMSLHTPRRGFAGTLAFATNWSSNKDNSLRVTANQMLIVGIGRSINGAGTVATFPVDAAAADHASNPACAGCHNQLDPMRQFLRQSWTYTQGRQTDATQNTLQANFQIDGVTATGTGVADFTNILASHPRFAIAWTEKMYFWATSRAAEENDPELQRIAGVFADSNYNYKTLVREMMSSPIVTYAKGTQTTINAGNTYSTVRRDQLCTALSNRLGLTDVCGAEALKKSASQTAIARVGSLIAADTYYRSYELPSLPTDPDLFFRASLESVCGRVALLVVDPAANSGGVNKYPSADPTTAIEDMVTTVMAIPPADPRHADAVGILTDDYTANKAVAGVNAADALRSTFQAACLSPTSAIVGL